MAQTISEFGGRQPLVLTVPGLGGSGPAHWQSLWEQSRSDTARVEMGLWDSPRRNPWVTKLDQVIRTAEKPVVLAAHSLGCLAVAWWAELAGQPWGWPVAGALLVAPPDIGHPDAPGELAGFAPAPRTSLPFPSILVASEDDPFASIQRSFDMARDWGSHFVNIGHCGHINAASGIGLWHDGQRLLDHLVGAAEGSLAQGEGLNEILAAAERKEAGLRAI
ncbi:hypothetical protein ACFB49_05250 [Sphingomonas sp. DBB INV C78]|uniref:RBBP9/YdeN family alpha/beta hydrolase n=1 Tax=Sphingomonas sp. DBB INV C78 TaxID=3349434 RepID=UPI0036D25827